MTARAYVFSVWAPYGDECPAAVAAVVSGSLRGARTTVRGAGLRLVGKEPWVEAVTEEYDGWPTGEVRWRYAHKDRWESVTP